MSRERAFTTTVGLRVAAGLVFINGEPCSKTTARKPTTCVHSLKSIKPGDVVYRPLGNSSTRSARYLASEIEALETRTSP